MITVDGKKSKNEKIGFKTFFSSSHDDEMVPAILTKCNIFSGRGF